MTVKECYEQMGADYDGVMGRFRKEERVTKFLLKFLDDQSFEMLRTALKARSQEEAFRAAHTLKGVAQNLDLTRLYTTGSEMAEILRSGSFDNTDALMERLEADYAQAISLIRQLQP